MLGRTIVSRETEIRSQVSWSFAMYGMFRRVFGKPFLTASFCLLVPVAMPMQAQKITTDKTTVEMKIETTFQ
jgi:hypothetical protein